MLQAPSLRQPQQGEQVLQVGVDAAVGQQAHQVQGRALLQAGVHGVPVGGIFIKAPVGNGFGDPGQVLEHHPAGADVGVTHLAVAHLPSGRPTSRPEARSVVWAYSRKNWSSRGVAAARMALPSVSCRRPKPSMMMRVVGVLFIEISSRSLSHKTALPELTPGWLR